MTWVVVLSLLVFFHSCLSLGSTTSVSIYSGSDLVRAFSNQSVTQAVFEADIWLHEEDFSGFQIPIVVERNLTIVGSEKLKSLWPVFDFGSPFVQKKVLLAEGVNFTLHHVVMVNFRSAAHFQAPGLDLFVARQRGSKPTFIFEREVAIIHRACFPSAIQKASVAGLKRPPGYDLPPNSTMISDEPNVPDCINVTTTGINAHPLARCWPDRGTYVNVIYYCSDLDPVSKAPVAAGYDAVTVDSIFLCEIKLTESCVAKYNAIGCFAQLVPQNMPLLHGPYFRPQEAATSSRGDGRPLGPILGGVLGGVAFLVLAAVGLAVLVRRLPGRTGGPPGPDASGAKGAPGQPLPSADTTAIWVNGTNATGASFPAFSACFGSCFGSGRRYCGSGGAGAGAGDQREGSAGEAGSGNLAGPTTGINGGSAVAVNMADGGGASAADGGGAEAPDGAGDGGQHVRDGPAGRPEESPTAEAASIRITLSLRVPDQDSASLDPPSSGATTRASTCKARTSSSAAGVARGGSSSAAMLLGGRQGRVNSAFTATEAEADSFQDPACQQLPVTPLTPQRPDLVMGVRIQKTHESQRPPPAGGGGGTAATQAAGLGLAPGAAGTGRMAAWLARLFGRRGVYSREQKVDQHNQQQQQQKQEGQRSDPGSSGGGGGGGEQEAGPDEVQLLPELLGKGSCGRVHVGLYGGRRVAVKVIAESMIPMELYQGGGGGDGGGGHVLMRGALAAAAGGVLPPEGIPPGGGQSNGAPTSGSGSGGAAVDGGGRGPAGGGGGGGGGGGLAATGTPIRRAFEQEVEVLGRCQHPNIVRLLAANLRPPRVCLVMELMETSLERLIHTRNSHLLRCRLPIATVLHVGIEIARGLDFLHPTIIHRDLKPANVLLSYAASPRPVVKITDFGLSRLRSTVLVTKEPEVGTPPYMAPEVFDPSNFLVTDRLDIYALGVILWEMLSGSAPWAGLTMMEIAYAITIKGTRLPLTAEFLGGSEGAAAGWAPRLHKLLTQCWDPDPQRRPAASEIVKKLLILQESLERQG